MAEVSTNHPSETSCSSPMSCPTFIYAKVLHVQSHLVWSSLEDAGALVDRLGPQADIFVLQLLGCAVHRFGNQAAFWYLALQRKTCIYEHAHKQTHRTGSVSQKMITWELKSWDTHHTLPSQEVRDDLLVYVVHQPSRTLVVIACIDEELLAGVFINKWTHLRTEEDEDIGYGYT